MNPTEKHGFHSNPGSEPEIARLRAAAGKIRTEHGSVYPEPCSGETFFSLPDTAFLRDDVAEYAFETPVEFRAALTELWKFRHAEHLEPFLAPVSVALFKNRRDDDSGDGKISTFIYEF